MEQIIHTPEDEQYKGTDPTFDEDLRTEIESRWKNCEAFYRNWQEQGKEDYDFALGKQWTPEELEKLKEEGRPALTFNRIRPLINLVSGYQRENSARIKVSPEGGEDKLFSEVMDKLIKAIDKWSKLSYKLGYQFDEGLYCGKSFLEATIDYQKDPIRGELKFVTLGPFKVWVDPECREYDISEGADYAFKFGRFTKATLKKMFPEHKDKIAQFNTDNDSYEDNAMLEGDEDNYGNDPNKATVIQTSDFEDTTYEGDQKFTLKEYWRKKPVKKYFVLDGESNEPMGFEDKESAEAFADTQGEGIEVVERTVTEMHTASMVCGHILQDIISPLEPRYTGFPFFRFIADWAPTAETEEYRVMGITRALKDVQREKNKAKSQTLHILNTQANSGWIGDDDALSPEGFKMLEKMGSTPGLVIKKKKGSELTEIQAKGPNIGHIQREQKADDEFVAVSGIHPELLGIQEKSESGRAMAMRIKQGITSLTRIFYNYRYTKEILGKFILTMLPEVFDAKKVMKVLGPKYMASTQSEAYPEGLTEGVIIGFLTMVKDHKYDIEVTEADQSRTTRAEVFDQLAELAQSGYPIPPQLLLQYMDIANSDEVNQQIEQYMAQQQEAQKKK